MKREPDGLHEDTWWFTVKIYTGLCLQNIGQMTALY